MRSVDWEPWRAVSRTRNARRFSEIARGIWASEGGDHGAERAARFYRKALRTLDPAFAAITDSAGTAAEAAALRDALHRRLAHLGLAAWLVRHRRKIFRVALPAIIVLASMVLAVPTLRRFLFPPDLAAGKPWVASSESDGFPGKGLVSDNPATLAMFHTREEPSPNIVIDLGAATEIRRVRVTNRLDCCGERVLPLAVEIGLDGKAWKRVAYRRMEFHTWTAEFPRQSARFVRLRIDRQSTLHLRTVSVY